MAKAKKRQILVIGLGRFGGAVAKTLCEDGFEVLGLDSDPAVVDDYGRILTQTVQADATDADVMRALGMDEFDTAFVAVGGDVRTSCICTMLLSEFGIGSIIAKAADEFHGRMLEKLGATQVLYPERDMGKRVAHNFASGNLLDFLELSSGFCMAELKVKPQWCGKALKELNLRGILGVNVVAVRSGNHTDAMPGANTVLHENDILLVVTDAENMLSLEG